MMILPTSLQFAALFSEFFSPFLSLRLQQCKLLNWDASWVPDPVTGHYRPANRAASADPADLRAAHLGRTYARA